MRLYRCLAIRLPVDWLLTFGVLTNLLQVSCSLCRRKKLRCSRQQPCSNCLARGAPCEREVGLPTTNVTNSSPVTVTAKAQTGDQNILARLQRVEALLVRLDAKVSPRVYSPKSNSALASPHATPQSHQSLQQVFQPPSDTEAAHKADTQLLDNIGTRDNALMLGFADQMCFSIRTVAEVAAFNPANNTACGPLMVILPSRQEAHTLLALYEEHIEYLHHVTYAPRTRAVLVEVYDKLESGDTPNPGYVALLASVFASTSALQLAIGDKRDLLGILPEDAKQTCHYWAKATFDCLDTSTRMGCYGLEDLQAIVTAFFLMYNLEGFSSRSRTGIGLAVAIAKDLGLHRVDCPSMAQHKPLKPNDKIDLEIKRRLWWHLTATDWQLGVTGGPMEGTYSVQPRHIATNFPRHLEEEDIARESPSFERPLSVPTASSYFIQRIRLAEICRKIIDATPLGTWGSDSTRYEDVMALDLEFEKFKRELPPFFQDTPEALERYRELYRQRPAILVQKHTVNMIYQNRRCRLHQPYLVRGFSDAAYAQSRDVCLQSARAVLAVNYQLKKEELLAASLLSLSGTHHHIFFATVALVMDLCFNKTDGDEQQEAARRAEVMDACRLLEEAKDRSPVAKRFLDSLMDVLKKHKVRLFDTTTDTEQVVLPALPTAVSEFDPTGTAQSEFEEIWQSYIEHGPTMDLPDWAELFDDLQTQL